MKVTRLRVKSFRGIEEVDQDIPDAGVLVTGKSGGGKTSVLNALHAGLQGRDIGPDAIRLGSDRAEILIDMDNASVRRAISRKGTSLKVTTADGVMRAPQTWLSELFGASIDPLALLDAAPKDRRKMILEAVPMTVSIETLRRFAPDLPDDTDVDGHGVEVLERVRELYYDKRTVANAAAKAALDEASRAQEAALTARDATDSNDAMPVADAEQMLSNEQARLTTLGAQAAEAIRANAATTQTRTKIAALRQQAELERSLLPADNHEKAGFARVRLRNAEDTVARLRTELVQAEKEQQEAYLAAQAEDNLEKSRHAILERSIVFDTQAHDLESALAGAVAPTVDPQRLADAEAAVLTAAGHRDRAKAWDLFHRAGKYVDVCAIAATDTAAAAAALDSIVHALTQDAPSYLFAQSAGIEGLAFEGDEVFLDKIRLSGLGGRDRLRFAINIAKRANAKAKILIVDGLERVDDTQLEEFVAECTSGGFQLLATRVSPNDVIFESLQPGS
jgi:hypothetical protein